MATSGSDDIDPEQLISRLCGPLAPADRAAFRAAAESALGTIVCVGEGIAYRVLRDVWRAYFHPPTDQETGHHPFLPGSRRLNKFSDGSPIGRDDPRTGGRDRHRLQVVG
jgi:hypothetical protein